MKTPWMPPLVASFMALAAPAVVAQGPDPSAQVEQLFRDKCIDCHGADVARPKGGFAGVERVDELLKNSKYVKRFDPSNSLLYRYLSGAQTPQMPKGDEPLSDGELALVRTWIGEKPSGSGTAGGKVGDGGGGSLRLMDDEEIIRTIHHDLSSLPQDDRSHYRYISYANLWNERRPDGASVLEQMAFEREIEALIEQSRHGFVKMLNSLSWSPRMVLPKRVDEAGLVERIDLRELRCADRVTPWSGAQWDMLCAKYPYGRSLGIDLEAAIEKWLGTQLPFVRADWFVYAASRPPLYHDLLGLPGADGRPGADRALELMLGVDVPTNIIEGKRIARAGIRNKQSGVSQHNRLIERHDLADGAYYWKSYDFENSVDKRNVVLRPFGPASLPGLPVDQREVAFDHDGGEIIFSLPNGLQGYLLVTEDGTRIDDGPSKIVFDRDDSADVKGQITNGVSCIACHAAGINLKLDEIREGALNVVSRGLKDELQALYPDGKEMNQLQEADKERFMAAVAGLGITAKCDQTQCEVVRGVSLRFAENLTYERAAAEFGLAPVEFGDALGGRLKGLRQQLKAGAVSRAEFINRFKEIIEDNPDLGRLSGCAASIVGGTADEPVIPALAALPPQMQSMAKQAIKKIAVETDLAKLREGIAEFDAQTAAAPEAMLPFIAFIKERMLARIVEIESGRTAHPGAEGSPGVISGSNGNHSIGAGSTITDLVVSGSNNTVRVEAPAALDLVTLSGSNNSIKVARGAVVREIVFSGSNNTVSGVDRDAVDVTDSGSNNSITP